MNLFFYIVSSINNTYCMETIAARPPVKFEYPSLSERVQSTFIDSIFIITMMFVFSSVLERFDHVPDWIRIALFFSIWGIYEPLCISSGCTIGNYLKGIRVRQFANPLKKLNIFRSFLRYLFKIALGWVSFLTIHSNDERRAIHDFASGSIMIKK